MCPYVTFLRITFQRQESSSLPPSFSIPPFSVSILPEFIPACISTLLNEMGCVLWVVITRTCCGQPEVPAGKTGCGSSKNRRSSAIFIVTEPQNSGVFSLAGAS